MRGSLRFIRHLKMECSSLVIGWGGDVCELGTRVINSLNQRLGGQDFCEIDPTDFFPLSGVAIEDNLIQFPESRFYACPDRSLALFLSHPPTFDWYDFLNLILDVAVENCHVKEIYAIGGMVFLGAHTTPRHLFGVFSSEEERNVLRQYDIGGDWDYDTPSGQRPTLNSLLLWTAKKRGIPATNLWVPTPFYLAPIDDPKARRMIIEFLDRRLGLGINFADLDKEIDTQNRRLAEFRRRLPEVDDSIRRLETNLSLSEEESQRLVVEVDRLLKSEES